MSPRGFGLFGPNPVACATGYTMSSLRDWENRNFKTRQRRESQFASLARRVGVNRPMRGDLGNLRVGRNNISDYAELGDTCE